MHGFEIRGGGALRSTTLPGRSTTTDGGPPPGPPRGHDGRHPRASRPSGGRDAPPPTRMIMDQLPAVGSPTAIPAELLGVATQIGRLFQRLESELARQE